MPKKSKKGKQKRHQMKKSKKGQTPIRRPKASGVVSSRFRDDAGFPDDDGPEIVVMNPSGTDVPLVENGYRIVGPAQAMVDYAKPLLDKAESEEDFNKGFMLTQRIWNLALLEDRDPEEFEEQKEELTDEFDMPEAEVDSMIERFHLMFPYVGKVPSFYFRERVIDVEEYEPFDESTIHISEDRIAPTEKEIRLARALSKINPGRDESRLSKWQDEVLGYYVEWCIAKGVPDDRTRDFANTANLYMDFLSGYHGETVSEYIPAEIVQEFMRTHFIRKTAMPAQEKTMMPFALKLFMQYLDEKGISSETERVREIIELEQDDFQKNLRLFTDPSLGSKKIIPFRRKNR